MCIQIFIIKTPTNELKQHHVYLFVKQLLMDCELMPEIKHKRYISNIAYSYNICAIELLYKSIIFETKYFYSEEWFAPGAKDGKKSTQNVNLITS